MPGDNDDVVGPAQHHDVPVFSLDCKVTCSITVLYRVPIFLVPLIIVIHGAEHGRPGCFYHKEPSCAGWHGIPILVYYIGNHTRYCLSSKPGTHGFPYHGRNHLHSGFGLPPGINNGAPISTDCVVIPYEGLGIEGLTNGSDHTEGAEVVLLWPFLPHLHEHPDRSRGRIEDIDLLLLD